LAISESTRQDAIKFLDIPPDRVVSISAAASNIFQKKQLTKIQTDELQSRFGITKPFVFYTGNVEYHKNLEMTLRAYSQLPNEIRRRHQLVLTHTGDEAVFRNRIRTLGLDNQEVIITGHISDQDLVDLYNCCKLYIFPSLYEGFGLPILEAMACGAPVIAANNSSIPEVMGREDAMFDASSDHSITNALNKALIDDHFRMDLSAYGLERTKQFTWERTARKAWEALEETLGKSQQNKSSQVITHIAKPKLRIAYVSPLPPQKSGIADYSADLLPHLSKLVHIDLFVDPELAVTDPYIKKNF
jgi:glycosyltransferase involved in cell wall biosynthesis